MTTNKRGADPGFRTSQPMLGKAKLACDPSAHVPTETGQLQSSPAERTNGPQSGIMLGSGSFLEA